MPIIYTKIGNHVNIWYCYSSVPGAVPYFLMTPIYSDPHKPAYLCLSCLKGQNINVPLIFCLMPWAKVTENQLSTNGKCHLALVSVSLCQHRKRVFFSRAPVGTYCTSHLFYLLFLPKLSPCRFCPLITTLLCASSPHPPPAPASPWHPPSQPFPLCSLDFWFHGQQAYTLGHHPGGSLHFPPPQRLCLSSENTDASPFQAEGVNPPFPTKPRARKGLAFFHFLIAVSKPWLLHW